MYAKLTIATAALVMTAGAANAADWSDTALSVRYGTTFAEPYDNHNSDGSGRVDIKKTIIALTHASGYKFGTNFFNVDLLMSNGADPAGGTPGNSGAQEAYIVYRNTVDFGKVASAPLKFGPVKDVGLTLGLDWNTKNDFYSSKKRMFVLGPTLMFDVPGFLNLTALVLSESNAPENLSRYTYKAHGALELDWGIPVASLPLIFKGYALFIGAKGENEFASKPLRSTSPETHVDMMLMYDAGAALGYSKNSLLVGVEYEYWRNKFGNPTKLYAEGGGGDGATASTPMVRLEYHF